MIRDVNSVLFFFSFHTFHGWGTVLTCLASLFEKGFKLTKKKKKLEHVHSSVFILLVTVQNSNTAQIDQDKPENQTQISNLTLFLLQLDSGMHLKLKILKQLESM